MAKYICLPISPLHIVPEFFFVSRDHLPKDRKPYNQYYRCANDPQYDQQMEDFIMLFRPLFWTSFWCHDWMSLNSWFGAKTVIISSASSKTSFCLAYLAKKNTTNQQSPLHIIGLTSKSNTNFTKSLGLYDEVLTYKQIKDIDVSRAPFAYVDVTGNPELYSSLVFHIGKPKLVKAVSLGMTQHDSASEGVGFKGLEIFFTPEWMKKRRESLSVEDIVNITGRAWEWLLEDCEKWIKIKKMNGKDEVESGYKEVLTGKVSPDYGFVFSMWKNYEWLAKL